MSTFNYRIIRAEGYGGYYDPYYAIHEVHYHEDGQIRGWSEDPDYLAADSLSELRGDIDLILQAFDRPILIKDGDTLVEFKPDQDEPTKD